MIKVLGKWEIRVSKKGEIRLDIYDERGNLLAEFTKIKPETANEFGESLIMAARHATR